MYNLYDVIFDSIENQNISMDIDGNKRIEIFFIQGKKELVCVEKNSNQIIKRIPLPYSLFVINDNKFAIKEMSNQNQQTNLYFSINATK